MRGEKKVYTKCLKQLWQWFLDRQAFNFQGNIYSKSSRVYLFFRAKDYLLNTWCLVSYWAILRRVQMRASKIWWFLKCWTCWKRLEYWFYINGFIFDFQMTHLLITKSGKFPNLLNIFNNLIRGKSLLGLWVTTFLLDWQQPLIFVRFISNFFCMCSNSVDSAHVSLK